MAKKKVQTKEEIIEAVTEKLHAHYNDKHRKDIKQLTEQIIELQEDNKRYYDMYKRCSEDLSVAREHLGEAHIKMLERAYDAAVKEKMEGEIKQLKYDLKFYKNLIKEIKTNDDMPKEDDLVLILIPEFDVFEIAKIIKRINGWLFYNERTGLHTTFRPEITRTFYINIEDVKKILEKDIKKG